jgi:hypothetical protein
VSYFCEGSVSAFSALGTTAIYIYIYGNTFALLHRTSTKRVALMLAVFPLPLFWSEHEVAHVRLCQTLGIRNMSQACAGGWTIRLFWLKLAYLTRYEKVVRLEHMPSEIMNRGRHCFASFKFHSGTKPRAQTARFLFFANVTVVDNSVGLLDGKDGSKCFALESGTTN